MIEDVNFRLSDVFSDLPHQLRTQLPDDREIERAGRERRRGHDRRGGRKRIDYSDKGKHDWYLVSATHEKCSKCQVIREIAQEPRYYYDVHKHSWKSPKCTHKGRPAK